MRSWKGQVQGPRLGWKQIKTNKQINNNPPQLILRWGERGVEKSEAEELTLKISTRTATAWWSYKPVKIGPCNGMFYATLMTSHWQDLETIDTKKQVKQEQRQLWHTIPNIQESDNHKECPHFGPTSILNRKRTKVKGSCIFSKLEFRFKTYMLIFINQLILLKHLSIYFLHYHCFF